MHVSASAAADRPRLDRGGTHSASRWSGLISGVENPSEVQSLQIDLFSSPSVTSAPPLPTLLHPAAEVWQIIFIYYNKWNTCIRSMTSFQCPSWGFKLCLHSDLNLQSFMSLSCTARLRRSVQWLFTGWIPGSSGDWVEVIMRNTQKPGWQSRHQPAVIASSLWIFRI